MVWLLAFVCAGVILAVSDRFDSWMWEQTWLPTVQRFG